MTIPRTIAIGRDDIVDATFLSIFLIMLILGATDVVTARVDLTDTVEIFWLVGICGVNVVNGLLVVVVIWSIVDRHAEAKRATVASQITELFT